MAVTEAALRGPAVRAARRRLARQGKQKEQKEQEEEVSIFQYIPAMALAALKDFLDFTIVLALPGVGMAVDILFVPAILLILMITAPQGATKPYRYMILLGMIPVEGLVFGLNLFPLMTGSVIWIYRWEKIHTRILEKEQPYAFKA